MNKKALQIVLAILGLIPILTGGLDLILGASSLNIDGASFQLRRGEPATPSDLT